MDELLTQIFELAIKVNRETEKAVIFHYSGNTDGIQLVIAKSKDDYCNWEYTKQCYLDEEWKKEAMPALAEMKEVLCGLLPDEKEIHNELIR